MMDQQARDERLAAASVDMKNHDNSRIESVDGEQRMTIDRHAWNEWAWAHASALGKTSPNDPRWYEGCDDPPDKFPSIADTPEGQAMYDLCDWEDELDGPVPERQIAECHWPAFNKLVELGRATKDADGYHTTVEGRAAYEAFPDDPHPKCKRCDDHGEVFMHWRLASGKEGWGAYPKSRAAEKWPPIADVIAEWRKPCPDCIERQARVSAQREAADGTA